ncbi:hypothetical protein LINPERPRIM_LOCUS6157, partial [Linum perenne]
PSPILSPASSLHQLHILTICKRHRTTVIYQLCSRFCSFLVSVRYLDIVLVLKRAIRYQFCSIAREC